MKSLIYLTLFAVLLSLSFASAVGVYPPVNESMVLYLHLNNNSLIGENNTFVVDSSGKGNNATVYNATWNATGGYLGDGAFEFNGSTDYMQIPDSDYLSPVIYNGYTISLWTRFNSIIAPDGNGQKVIAKGNVNNYEYEIRKLNGSNNIGFYMYKYDGSSHCLAQSTKSLVTANTWHFITASYNNATNCSIYVDDGTDTSTASVTTNSLGNWATPLRIGYRNDNAGIFNGSIDDLIFWNRTLSALEIWNNYYNYVQCINPVNNQVIYNSAIFCNSGSYIMNGSGSNAINILANDLTLNCNYSNLTGRRTNAAINFNQLNNITIINCNLLSYIPAISIYNSTNITIKNITIFNASTGILLNNVKNLNLNTVKINITTGRLFTVQNCNGTFFNNLDLDTGFYGFSIINSSNTSINNASIYNVSSSAAFEIWQTSSEITINNSNININTIGIQLSNANNLNVYNTIINNSNNNYDGYNVGISLDRIVSDILIVNSTIINYGSFGVLIRNASNVNISQSYFNQEPIITRALKSERSYLEPNAAIGILELYKSWYGDGTETTVNLTSSQRYKSYNINISGNTFGSEVQIKLRNQGGINVSNDLTDYVYRKFQIPNDWVDPDEFWIRNDFTNISIVNYTAVRNELGQDWMYGYNRVILYEIFSSYIHFWHGGKIIDSTPSSDISKANNEGFNFTLFNQSNQIIYSNNHLIQTNTTEMELNFTLSANGYLYAYNKTIFNTTKLWTNALFFYPNGTVIKDTTISNNDGYFNYQDLISTLNNFSYAFNEFNLSYGTSRENSPINITQIVSTKNSRTYHISSLINENIIISVYNLSFYTCDNIKLKVIRADKTEFTPDFDCEDNIISIAETPLSYSTESNEIIISYNYKDYNNELCTSLITSYPNLFKIMPAFFIILGLILILGIVAAVITTINDPDWYKDIDFSFISELDYKYVFLGVGILAIISIISIIIIYSMCMI